MNTLLNYNLKCELARLQEKHGFPGITCAYVLSDGSSGEVASGFADIETKEPMTTRSRMLAASIGKTFVAAIVLAAAEEGHLHLYDPLSLWLSKYSCYYRIPNHDTITIRHLLTHSAGVPDHVYTTMFKQFFSRNETSLCEPNLQDQPKKVSSVQIQIKGRNYQHEILYERR